MTEMKEKDRQFVMEALGLDDSGVRDLFSKITAMPLDGEHSRENYVQNLCNNMRGRDRYELKKILLTRLS